MERSLDGEYSPQWLKTNGPGRVRVAYVLLPYSSAYEAPFEATSNIFD